MATLNARHRCDRCQAQAYVVTTLAKGGMLMWCNHHWSQYRRGLEPLTVDLIDETATLYHSIVDDKHAVG